MNRDSWYDQRQEIHRMQTVSVQETGDLPPENCERVAQNLESLLDRRAAKVRDICDAELDAAVDEAVDHVRHSRK